MRVRLTMAGVERAVSGAGAAVLAISIVRGALAAPTGTAAGAPRRYVGLHRADRGATRAGRRFGRPSWLVRPHAVAVRAGDR